VQELISDQIRLLQADQAFRQFCQKLYARGYKDWVIVMAVLNCMMHWVHAHEGKNWWLENAQSASLEAEGRRLKGTTYPAWRFMEQDMEMYLTMHGVTVLSTYGFELRRPDINPEVVEKFLRCRMNHFEPDLPHSPLFGEPPGDWPA
jgi:hypothetical protein